MLRSPTLTARGALAGLTLATITVIVAACGSATTPAVHATPPPPTPPAAPVTGPAAASPPGFELVESVPIETTLDHPELRDASDVWLDMIAGAHTSIDLAQFYA